MHNVFAVLLSFVIALGAAPAQAQSTEAAKWLAVAANANTGNFGYAFNHKSKGSAAKRAKEVCVKFSEGASGCKIVLQGTTCAGVARANGQVFVAPSETQNKAGRAALSGCKSRHGAACKLEAKICNN